MNQKLALILFTFAFVVAIVVGLGGKEDLRPAPAEFRAKFHETLLKPRRLREPVKQGTPPERNPSSHSGTRQPSSVIENSGANEPLNREDFLSKYSERLEVTEYEGRVIRFDGAAISSEGFTERQKLPRFRPSSSAEVSARAREVFENARHLLGVSDFAEFILHPPTTGESSAQTVIQQSENGIPISPGGLVTILLGTDGEVRSIDSSVYPKVEVANSATIAKPEAAREILYVTQSAPTAVVRHAYETRERGIQKVVDAQTGAILLEKDRRIR